MNSHFLIWEHGWQTAGWTMVYYLALGSLVALLAAALRWLLRSADPALRYATSLAVFTTLALMPVGIAIWLSQTPASEFPLSQLAPAPAPPVVDLAITPLETDSPLAQLQTPAPLPPSEPAEHGNQTAWTTAHVIEYLPWVWLAGTPLTFVLLATGLIGAERLRRTSRIVTEGPVHDAGEQLRAALGVGRRVTLAICDRLATPLMVGIVRPLILLPPAALTGWSADELEMVLLHELAHIRRWDNLVNLLQRIVESLLFFHPAVWIVSRWVRRDREDCCDAVVVAHTAKPQAYAELLVALASTTQPLAGLAMARHPLAGRIRRILHLEDETMLVSRNTLVAISTALLAVVLTVSCYSPRETEADEATERLTTEGTEQDGSAEGFGKRLEKTMDAAVREVQRIRAAGKAVGLEIHDTGAFEVVATSVADVKHLDENAASSILMRLVHEPTSENSTRSEVYDLPPSLRIDSAQTIGDLFEGLEQDPRGPQVKIDWKWEESGRAVRITAPKAAHWLWRATFKMFAEKEPRIYSAESEISMPYSDPRWNTPKEREIYQQTQLAMIRSHWVLNRAIRDGNLSLLPPIQKARSTPLEWLTRELKVQYNSEGKMLVQLSGKADNQAQLAQIVRAIVRSYLKELKHGESLRSRETRESLKKLHRELVVELQQKMDRFQTLSEQLDSSDSASTSAMLRKLASDVRMIQQQIIKKQEYLLDIEVTKKLAVQQANSTSALEAAIQEEMARDPMIQSFQQEQLTVIQQMTQLRAITKRKNPPEVKRLQQHLETLKQQIQEYRITKEAELRSRFKSAPNDLLAQVMSEYMIRRRSAERDLVELQKQYEEKLEEVQRKGQTSGSLAILELEITHLQEIERTMDLKLRSWDMEQLLGEREERQPRQQSTLLYDGKTFDDWRELWKTELKTENRIECIKALAAFGRAGKGKEAAEAILEIVKEYEWYRIMSGTPLGRLKMAAIAAMGGEEDGQVSEAIPTDDWLPVLTREVLTGNKRIIEFAGYVYPTAWIKVIHESDEAAIQRMNRALKDIGPVAVPYLLPHLLRSVVMNRAWIDTDGKVQSRKTEFNMAAADVLRQITGSDEAAIKHLESLLGDITPRPVPEWEKQQAKLMLQRLESRQE